MKNFRNWLLERFYLPLGDAILGYSTSKELKNCRAIDNLSQLELENLQEDKLRKILVHATNTCAAYIQCNTEVSNPFEWLNQFPILTKQQILGNEDAFLSNKFDKGKLISLESSGSSGVKTTVYLTKLEHSKLRAILIHWWEWTGFYLGKPILQTGITPSRGFVKSIKDYLTNTVYCNAFSIDENIALKKFRKIAKKRGKHLGGFASSLYVLARIAEEHKLEIKFDAAISWGDKLFEHYKKKIEQVFKTKVYENYGCNEGFMIGQKVDLDYFYIYTPNVYLELLDTNGYPVEDGEIGRVIVTKLDGYAMPLIRYDTGDLAVKLPVEEYPIIRRYNFPLLEKVIGRNTDIIKTPEGKSLIVHTFTGIFEFFHEIRQFRVIQSNIDAIEIEFIPSDTFEEKVISRLEKAIREKTNTSMKISWKEVAFIPPTASGKPQLIENRLIKNSLAQQS